jgi:hypothetical protein
MLFANWIDVPDAAAFLDAFAEAAEKTRGWKLESIKTDYGYQFVYVRYTGRKFAGKGLMASAFAPITGPSAPPIRTPSASARRSNAGERSHRPSLALQVPMQQVNITIRADEWPTHLHGDESAKRLVKPLVKAAHEALRPKLRVVRTRSVYRRRVAQIADSAP